MQLTENKLFKYQDKRLMRILYINQVSSIIYAIDLDSNKWPYPILKNDLVNHYRNNEMVALEEDNYRPPVPEESLSEIEKAKRDHAWEMVKCFKNKLIDEEHMFISQYRQKAIRETLATFNVSYNGLKNILIKYFKSGRIKSGLLPNYYRCGARGKEREVGEKKLGRPRKYNNSEGINIDANIKKVFKVGLNRYYYNERKNSLKTAYELTLRDFFASNIVDEKGVKIPLLNKAIPTYQQFLYWYKKMNDSKKEIIKRSGQRTYQQNYRSIVGHSTEEGWQIDSTQFDIYLCSSLNRNLIVGRPTLHLVICAYSRVIMGMSISFESLNGYTGEMIALANSMTSKVSFCKKYGITITDSEWPYAVPTKILADRGALNGSQIENAIENLGITIQQTPPYRADYKGIIESAFHQLNMKVKPFVDGVVINGSKSKERGEADYRLKATLTIEDFTKVIIKTILFHNNHHVLTDYILDETMIEENVEKIPMKLWENRLKHGKGYYRTLPEEIITTYLLPTDTALITPRGLSFRKLLYASDYSLRNGWFQKARIEGSSKVKICYNPMDLSEVYLFDESKAQLHKLTLLEHLTMYGNKGVSELEAIKNNEQGLESKFKEKELEEKLKLYTEIEEIVHEARVKTEEHKDHSLSKTQRIKGIKENQRNERLLQREKYKEPRTDNVLNQRIDELNELDEFAMFRGREE